MANGTTFGSGDSGQFSVPAIGVSDVVWYGGWVYFPANPDDNTEFGLGDISNIPYLIYYAWASRWVSMLNFSENIGTATPGGWVWIAFRLTRTSCDIYWRHADAYDLGHTAHSGFTYGGAAFTATIGGFGGDCQYWGVWQGSMTEAEALAQSQTTTPNAYAYSWFPLNENSGTGTIGGRNMTLSGTSTATREAPASAVPAADTTLSTEILRYPDYDYAVLQSAPFSSTNGDGSVVAWIKLEQNVDRNFYYLGFYDPNDMANTGLTFVLTHWVDATEIAMNIMSFIEGLGNDYCATYSSGYRPTTTLAECIGWIGVAWSWTRSGANSIFNCWVKFPGDANPIQIVTNVSVPHAYNLDGWHTRIGLNSGQASACNVQHFRVYNTALNGTQATAALASGASDTSAWAHWKLFEGDPADASGNSRAISILGEWWGGDAGPTLSGGESTTATVAASLVAPGASITATSGASLTATATASIASPTASITANSGASLSGSVSASLVAPGASATATSGASLTAAATASLVAPGASVTGSSGASLSAAAEASLTAPGASVTGTSGTALSGSIAASVPALGASVTGLSGATTATLEASLLAPTAEVTAQSGASLSGTVAASLVAPGASVIARSGADLAAAVSASLSSPSASATATIGDVNSATVTASIPSPGASVAGVSGADLTAMAAASLTAPGAQATATSGASLTATIEASIATPTASVAATLGNVNLASVSGSLVAPTASATGESGGALSATVSASIDAPTAAVTGAIANAAAVTASLVAPTASASGTTGESTTATVQASITAPTASAFAQLGALTISARRTARIPARTRAKTVPARSWRAVA